MASIRVNQEGMDGALKRLYRVWLILSQVKQFNSLETRMINPQKIGYIR
jgi:hypothetical protein